jgi:hypothetical protein
LYVNYSKLPVKERMLQMEENKKELQEVVEVTPAEEAALEKEELDDIYQLLTPQEKKYCEIMIMQKPKSKVDALRRAGSKASDKYLSKMAWEIEQREHVQKYLRHLQSRVVEEVGLDLQEIVNNAREFIQMAKINGKPKEAEAHNRLLAELGGFVKNSSSPVKETNITMNTQNNLRSDENDISKDIELLQGILSNRRDG